MIKFYQLCGLVAEQSWEKLSLLFFVLDLFNCCTWIFNDVQVCLVTHKHVIVFADSTCEKGHVILGLLSNPLCLR